MKFEIFQSIPEGFHAIELPSLSDEQAACRYKSLRQILGPNAADRAAKRVGPYLLDEELTEKLKMKGLDLPEDGELKALSANRWPREIAQVEELSSMTGVILTESQRKTFQSVMRLRRTPLSVTDGLELCRHLFFEQKVKVVVPYTAPRFHQS